MHGLWHRTSPPKKAKAKAKVKVKGRPGGVMVSDDIMREKEDVESHDHSEQPNADST